MFVFEYHETSELIWLKKFTKQIKKKQNLIWELYPKHIHIFRAWHKHMQMFHKELYKLQGTTHL